VVSCLESGVFEQEPSNELEISTKARQ